MDFIKSWCNLTLCPTTLNKPLFLFSPTLKWFFQPSSKCTHRHLSLTRFLINRNLSINLHKSPKNKPPKEKLLAILLKQLTIRVTIGKIAKISQSVVLLQPIPFKIVKRMIPKTLTIIKRKMVSLATILITKIRKRGETPTSKDLFPPPTMKIILAATQKDNKVVMIQIKMLSSKKNLNHQELICRTTTKAWSSPSKSTPWRKSKTAKALSEKIPLRKSNFLHPFPKTHKN